MSVLCLGLVDLQLFDLTQNCRRVTKNSIIRFQFPDLSIGSVDDVLIYSETFQLVNRFVDN